MDISSFCALALQYATENHSDSQFLFHCWKNRPTFSYREKEKGGLCSKLRIIDTGVVSLQRRDKKKGMQVRSHIVHEVWQISHTMQPWHSQANYDLKKYSCVTCSGEQSPSKFDTYSCQLKSTFSCAADL